MIVCRRHGNCLYDGKFCQKLDPNHQWEMHDAGSALSAACSDFNSAVADDSRITLNASAPVRQKTLSEALNNRTLVHLKHNSDACCRAHLELTSASGAGQWLHTVPNSAHRKAIDPLQYRTMVQQRLRAPVFDSEFPCPLCARIEDKFGDLLAELK